MKYKRITSIDTDACTGCRMCEMVCSLVHGESSINPKNSRIRIEEDPEKGIFLPKVCNLCEDNPCIEACPESALSKDEKSGMIIVDDELCTACESCIDACSYDAISIDTMTDKAIICDLCEGDPMCVKYCLQGAIVFMEPFKKGQSGEA